MALHNGVLTSNTTIYLSTANKSAGKDRYFGTVSFVGDFGGGTVALQYSPDGGTTKLAVQENGVDVTFTANGGRNVELGYGNSQNNLIVYATLSGASAPNIVAYVHDNAS